MYAIGLMSGTSLDGVDAALIDITEINGKIDYELIEFITKPFNKGIKEEIQSCISIEESDVRLICSLNFKLGYEFAEAAKLVCRIANIKLSSIEFISSHGQTVWHNPISSERYIPSTLQIGESAVIAYETNCQVVSNFRVMDMAAGGQGAPLVSYTDYLMYRDPERDIVLQNIGGIANLTYLPKGCTSNQVISFDTGPGNMMIDYVTEKYFGFAYDDGGNIARSGTVIEELLNSLMNDPYIAKVPPKTTGREYFGKEYIEQILSKIENKYQKVDILATFTMFVAQSIISNYQKYLRNIDLVIISGGGSFNTYLIDILKGNLKCQVKTLEEIEENSGAKEAIAFALLGYQTLHNRTNNLKSATGASNDVILGNITPKPWIREEI
jgi:anhydro-N-acetylmuramic acid kinase